MSGESHPIEIRADNNPDEKQREEDALHARNMAFNSALVVEGRGVGIVVRVGDKTMIGKIAHLVTAQNGTPQKSTLEVCKPLDQALQRRGKGTYMDLVKKQQKP